jgi:hypothetical protein
LLVLGIEKNGIRDVITPGGLQPIVYFGIENTIFVSFTYDRTRIEQRF